MGFRMKQDWQRNSSSRRGWILPAGAPGRPAPPSSSSSSSSSSSVAAMRSLRISSRSASTSSGSASSSSSSSSSSPRRRARRGSSSSASACRPRPRRWRPRPPSSTTRRPRRRPRRSPRRSRRRPDRRRDPRRGPRRSRRRPGPRRPGLLLRQPWALQPSVASAADHRHVRRRRVAGSPEPIGTGPGFHNTGPTWLSRLGGGRRGRGVASSGGAIGALSAARWRRCR